MLIVRRSKLLLHAGLILGLFRIAVGLIILVSYDFKLFQTAFALMITLIRTQMKVRAAPKPLTSHFRHLAFIGLRAQKGKFLNGNISK